MCSCFYATIKGQVSEAKGGKWSDHISDVMAKERKGSLGSWHQMCLCNSLLQLCLQTPAHHLPIIANLCHPAHHLPTYWDSTEAKLLFNPVLSEKTH